MIDIIREDDKYVYIHGNDSNPENLIDLKKYCKLYDKWIWDIDADSRKLITITPNVGHTLIPPRKPQFSRAEIRRAILSCDKPTTVTLGRALGVSTVTAHKYVERYDLQPLMDTVRIESIDKVENKLIQLAEEGNVRAIKLFLEAQAKNRGYGTNQPVIDTNVNVKLVFEDPEV